MKVVLRGEIMNICINWLIDWCLTSSEQFFSYIQDVYFTWRVVYVYRQVYITQLLTNGVQKLSTHPPLIVFYM